jgi:glycerol-3-phosphate dehydrogenase (NAD(P)+)
VALAARGPVTLWGRGLGWAEARENPRLPGVRLPDAITLTGDIPALTGPVLLAVPMQALGGFLAENAVALDGRPLVLCCKGIDLASLRGPSALVQAHCPAATPACEDDATGTALQQALATPTLRLYRTTDVLGAELGGALKNVIAIAAGIVMGAGLGDSARAALMTRGYAEMLRFATRLGARAETLAGLSGLGDLVLTCTSAQSRNFAHGLALGLGAAPPAATVEGLATARAVLQQALRFGIAAQMPVTAMVAAVTTGKATVAEAVQTLMSRPLKEE